MRRLIRALLEWLRRNQTEQLARPMAGTLNLEIV